jgi:hypothetical protein
MRVRTGSSHIISVGSISPATGKAIADMLTITIAGTEADSGTNVAILATRVAVAVAAGKQPLPSAAQCFRAAGSAEPR